MDDLKKEQQQEERIEQQATDQDVEEMEAILEDQVEGMEQELAEELSPEELLGQAQALAEQLADEKSQLDAQHLRLQADFDNFRKRSRQEREDLIKQANAQLVGACLPVLDNFERALNAIAESAEREGVQMIFRQLLEVLTAAGLEPIEALGQEFDPQLHEAILQTESGPENKGKVIGEAQKGYLFNGKLLRPAMVQIGS